ncbi:MMPL family transporter [Plantactinospora sp. S1510]|uniref:MMPL family transporter n=1 Tax=Plantactinospora alkalitolerans TaxID=2789879 RepID=A0ABS0GRX3_9ACTN|nr:MMPL family transporter [Plantactinospora alkalitolerans]MBF9128804.1 MMPL family transporter [Plantactinospora alkalitolerans]
MFERLGRFVVHNPWKVIIGWVVAAAAIVVFAPSLSDVTNTDQANFLPGSYESVKAQQLAEASFAQANDSSATIVVRRTDGQPLTDSDQTAVGALAQKIQSANVERVTGVVTGPQALSPNKQVQLISAGLKGLPDDPLVLDAVQQIRDVAKPAVAGTPLTLSVTGDVAMQLDNQDAFETAFLIVGIATVVLIIVLLLLIYRSPIAALLPIVTVSVVSAISPGLIALVAEATDLQVDQSLQIILTIVLYGIGTDYILFLLFRYRERLREGDDRKAGLVAAVARVGEVIASAAAAIVIAFMALLLAVFGAFKSLGPALAIAVVVMAFAAVTLVPAVVSLLGPKVFWPSKSWQSTPKGSVFRGIGRFVGRRPAIVAIASGGVMVALALGTLGMKSDYDQTAQLPEDTESSQGFRDLQSGFPAGALNPTTVYVRGDGGQRLDAAAVERFAQRLRQVPGVGGIMPAGESGESAALSQDGTAAQINLLLADSPYSNEALDLAGDKLRDVAHAEAPPGTTALVGGATSLFADVRDANDRDLRVIFPVAAALIALILGLMLRSIVAPVYLMVAVVLGFFSTLGATVLMFQGLGDRPGLSFMLPTILYLFVVAIGTDYNILMIARLREEARLGNEPRTAAALAVEHGGPSVGAAGLILAGTFASMMLGGVAFLSEMGFAVAIGITIAAFVMSMFLVPSLTALLGHAAWWPGHGDVRDDPELPVDDRSPVGAAVS